MELLSVTDRVFDRHRGGKIEVTPKFPVLTHDDLSMAYTPAVGRVCSAIAEQSQLVWDYTIKSNTVAVLTDGTAVLGLGDIGPEAAMPVMEGKAMLFKQLADVDAYPICLRTYDIEDLIADDQGDRSRLWRHQPGGYRITEYASKSSDALRKSWTSPCSTTISTVPQSCHLRPSTAPSKW